MLALLAVLALILYACSGSGSGKKQPVANGKGTPTASQSSLPSNAGDSSQAGGASGGATSPGAGTPSGGASGGPTSAGGVNGGVVGPTGGANGTPGGTGPTGGATSGPGCQLSVSLTTQAPAYANGDNPQFTVAVVNKGSADCDVDVSPKSLVLNIYSGQDHIWSSADCATGGTDVRGIAPGGVQTVTYTWNRTRSSAQNCSANGAPAQLGKYYGVVSLGPGTGPNAPAAQSQPKTFELKTGS